MAIRMTSTEKWSDPWFLDLSRKSKFLFLFLCDNCDIAGFLERHDKTTSFYLDIPITEFDSLYKELEKSVVIIDGIIWLKNFIRHQKNLPLNPDNNCHRSIIKSLVIHSSAFSNLYESVFGLSLEEIRGLSAPQEGLARGYSNSNSNSNGKALPPEGGLGGASKRKPNPKCEGCNGEGKLPDGVKCWCWK